MSLAGVRQVLTLAWLLTACGKFGLCRLAGKLRGPVFDVQVGSEVLTVRAVAGLLPTVSGNRLVWPPRIPL